MNSAVEPTSPKTKLRIPSSIAENPVAIEALKTLSGEQKLVCQVLFDAVATAQINIHGVKLSTYLSGEKERVVEAVAEAQWFLLDDDGTEAFSFTWCCEALNISPERARNAARTLLTKVLIPRNDRFYFASQCGQRRDGTYRKRPKDDTYALPQYA